MESVAASARNRLRQAGTAKARAGAQRFFKEPIQCYGVCTPFVREIVRDIWPVAKLWPQSKRNRLCELFWKSGMLEEGILVTDLCRRWQRESGRAEFELYGRWLDRYVSNWAACDGLCMYALAATVANEPALAKEMDSWARSPNRWKRRAALVGLVREGRKGRQVPRIRRLIKKLRMDPEEIVRKAAVWLAWEIGEKELATRAARR